MNSNIQYNASSKLPFENFNLNIDLIYSQIKQYSIGTVFSDCSDEDGKSRLRETIKNTYDDLSASDIKLNGDKLYLPTGFTTNEGSVLFLSCVPDKNNNSGWYCDRIYCFKQKKDKLQCDRKTLKENVTAFCDNIENEGSELFSMLLSNRRSSMYTNNDGIEFFNGNIRYIDTTLYHKENQQKLFAMFVYKPDSECWQYQCLVCSNPSLDMFPKNQWLQRWANFTDFSGKINELSTLTLPEYWGEDNRILAKYIKYTFCRIYCNYQNSIPNQLCFSGEYAAFNTGLPDRNYNEIYALFKKISPTENTSPLHFSQMYEFVDFICGLDGKLHGNAKIFDINFSENIPDRPKYFDTYEEMYLDPSIEPKISPNYYHILCERIERMPLFVYNIVWSDKNVNEVFHNKKASDSEKKTVIENALKDCRKCPTDDYDKVKREFMRHVEKALKNIRWNYRSAIPSYYPENNTLSWLVPLRSDDDKHTVALVVEKCKNNKGEIYYDISTVLDQDMAYSNARLICRPESDWLVPYSKKKKLIKKTNDLKLIHMLRAIFKKKLAK